MALNKNISVSYSETPEGTKKLCITDGINSEFYNTYDTIPKAIVELIKLYTSRIAIVCAFCYDTSGNVPKDLWYLMDEFAMMEFYAYINNFGISSPIDKGDIFVKPLRGSIRKEPKPSRKK